VKHFVAAAMALAVAGPSVSVFGQAFRQESIRTPEPLHYQTFAFNPEEPVLFRAGPFSGTGDVGLGYSFNDNADTTGTTATGFSKLSQNQIFENLDLNLAWVLSPLNRIDVQLDGQLQENYYSNGTNVLNVAIQASEIRFQVTVGDVLLQAYEQFALTQDPVLDPTIAGATNLNRLTNTIGTSASIPLYRAQAGLELDYTYNDTLGGGGGSVGSGLASQETGLIRNSLHVGGNFGFEIAPSLTLGVELNASHNTGAGPLDTNIISGGVFLRGNLTHLIEVDTGAGPLIGEGPGVDQPQYYVYLTARHHISRNLQVLLGASHDVDFSSGDGVALDNNFYIATQLQASRRWTVEVSPFVNFGEVITGTLPGRFTQYGVTVDSLYLLSGHISIDLNYRYTKREGDGASGSFAQNVFTVAFKYEFGASGE
jgi:hypothetical protein